MGARLRKLLEDNELTQTRLAKRLGISLSTLNGYITDYRQPDIHMLKRLAEELHTTTDYLILGHPPPGAHPESAYRQQLQVIAHNEGITLTREQEAAVARYMRFLLAEDGGDE